MVRVARQLVVPGRAHPRFAQSFAEQLPVRSASADLVTSNGVLMMTDRSEVLTECLRILRPGGRLQFGDLVFDSRPGHELVDEFVSLPSNALTRDRWRDLLVAVGFVDVEFGPDDHPERNRLGPVGGRAIRAVKP
jgi:ubiquinone/menaquinone biosynthesis C-methylase UbiE